MVKNGPKSMADIAKMLNVSSVSVSLALRNSPLISKELRKQVQKIADETGFKVRSYRKKSVQNPEVKGTILVLYDKQNPDDPVAQQILSSTMKRLSELKLRFELCECEDLYAKPELASGASGVIYHYCFRPWFSSILAGIPQVAIMHEEIDLGPWDNYKPNETLAGKLAADYLLKQGFENLILTWEHGMAYHAENHARLDGFRRRVREAEVSCREIEYDRDDDPQFYFNQLRETLAETGNKAGIFAFCDQVAYKVCHVLDFMGLERRSRELEVISCDNTLLIRNLNPPLPVVDLHIAEIAERAVDGLLWRLEHPEASHQDVLLKPELILPEKHN